MSESLKATDKSKKVSRKKKTKANDDISLVGSKGGVVKKERQLAHQIDLELRDFSYH